MSHVPPATEFPATRPNRRIRTWFIMVMLLVAGLIVADGSRCTPANPNSPVMLRGENPLATPKDQVLRVATFNIHSGRGRDRRTDLARTAAVFSVPSDLIGLNEVRGTWNSAWRPDQAADLGQRLGLQSAFVPTERRWWHDHFGNGLLSNIPLSQVHRIPLAGTRGKAFRCATLAQFEFQQQTVQVLSVHVDSQSDRERQLRAVLSLFVGLQPPAILIGDLNSNQDDPQMRELLARTDVVDALHDAPPDQRGRQHIDWILARGMRCRSCQLIENDASDHPAAFAELELLTSANPRTGTEP